MFRGKKGEIRVTLIKKISIGLGMILLLAFIPTAGVDASCNDIINSSYPGYEWLDVGACGCMAYGIEGMGWTTDGWQPEYGKACEQLCSTLWDCRYAERGEVPTTGRNLLDQLPRTDTTDELLSTPLPTIFPLTTLPTSSANHLLTQ
jgi:hypothetical protein